MCVQFDWPVVTKQEHIHIKLIYSAHLQNQSSLTISTAFSAQLLS